MMKRLACLALVVTGLLLTVAVPAHAWGRRGHGHVGFRTPIVIGAPFWGPPVWVGPYWYPPYVYAPPPVVIREEPQVYVQQQPAPPPPQPQQSYWYYCADSKAYYPYVQQCPAGWLKVVPEAAAPAR